MPQPQKPFLQRLLELRLLLVVNAVILVLFSLSFGREFIRNFEIQRDIESLQTQADELSATNLQISQLNTAFQTESFIEREARLKLGMKKPGETVVVIQSPQEGTAQEVVLSDQTDPLNILTDEPSTPERVANPNKWWYYFFDKQRFNDYSSYD